MKWMATMEDESNVYESLECGFNDLDHSKVKEFYLIDEGENFVPYDSSCGIFRFNNLDTRKFSNIADGQKLLLEFDKTLGIFKLTKSSFEALCSIQSQDELSYKLGFDSKGNISVNGTKLVLGIQMEKLYTFNKNRFYELIQFKDGYSDVKMKENIQVNKIHRTSAFNIGFVTRYEIEEVEFDVKVILSYNLVSQSVQLNYWITSNKDISLKIYLNYEGNERFIPVKLTQFSPMQTKRVLDLLK